MNSYLQYAVKLTSRIPRSCSTLEDISDLNFKFNVNPTTKYFKENDTLQMILEKMFLDISWACKAVTSFASHDRVDLVAGKL